MTVAMAAKITAVASIKVKDKVLVVNMDVTYMAVMTEVIESVAVETMVMELPLQTSYINPACWEKMLWEERTAIQGAQNWACSINNANTSEQNDSNSMIAGPPTSIQVPESGNNSNQQKNKVNINGTTYCSILLLVQYCISQNSNGASTSGSLIHGGANDGLLGDDI